MINPNTPSTQLTAMETYAQLVEPEYDIPPGGQPPMETPEWQNGVIPLDTLPAAWWNWMWKTITEQEKRMVRFFNSIFTEFSNLLTTGGIASFDETVTNQLVLAIQAIARTPATTLICGAIKAGTAYGTLAVDGTTGVATVNGAGTGQFNTLAQNITDAINELDGDIGQEINDRTSADNTLQDAIDGKAPTNHASDEVDPDTGKAIYGQADGLNFGHVKLSDDYTDTTLDTTQGVAATPRAVALAVAAAGTTYSSVPIGTVASYAGPVTVAPRGWLPCDGRAVSRTAYAALYTALGGANSPWGQGDGSTTFNVPDLRESTLVGTDQRTAGVTDHDTYTLGEFKDDQFQSHGHGLGTLNLQYISSQGSYISNYAYSPLRLAGDGSGTAWTNMASSVYRFTGSIGTPNSGRYGTTTHGKQTGINWIIKYEDVQADVTLMEYVTNQNKLSARETVTPDSSGNWAARVTAGYDGYITCTVRYTWTNPSAYPTAVVSVKNNGAEVAYITNQRFSEAPNPTPATTCTIPVQKGDVITVDFSLNSTYYYGSTTWAISAQYYKDRDYGA